MKTIMKFIAPAALMMLGLASCGEDSWNNHLDGFEGGENMDQVVPGINYTLTAADYKRFADNRFNKALAAKEEADGTSPNAVKALAAVANQQYITPATPAELYMPNLLNDSLFTYYAVSNGSSINVTYREVSEVPELIQGVNASSSYKVTSDDYQTVYAGDEDYIDAFSPMHPVSECMSDVLKEALPDAEAGDFVVAQYSETDTNPNFNLDGPDYGTVSVSKYGAYKFDGSKWTSQDVTMIQPADFASMGLTYGNFSGTQAAEYLPKFLALAYPYAQEDDEMYIGYKYFANKETTNACALWAFDGMKWYDKVATNGVHEVTNQFVKRDGKWELDPSITITLPTGKGQAYSATFYQACVDWVKDNVPDGDKYVTSYGNNDYYTGASAYQNNIDLRPGSARLQYAAAYEGMTDEEVVATMKKRFEDQVAPAVLHEWYPDMAPMGDFHPTVTIHFYIYDGATKAETIVFECESKGEFKFVSCTWNETEE